jgi:hypothetical protein
MIEMNFINGKLGVLKEAALTLLSGCSQTTVLHLNNQIQSKSGYRTSAKIPVDVLESNLFQSETDCKISDSGKSQLLRYSHHPSFVT